MIESSTPICCIAHTETTLSDFWAPNSHTVREREREREMGTEKRHQMMQNLFGDQSEEEEEIDSEHESNPPPNYASVRFFFFFFFFFFFSFLMYKSYR